MQFVTITSRPIRIFRENRINNCCRFRALSNLAKSVVLPMLVVLHATTACVANERLVIDVERIPGWSGPYSGTNGLTERSALVIRDVEAWANIWDRIHTIRRPKPPLPDVDFARKMVILVALGRRPSSGYSVEISSATQSDGKIHVDIKTTLPGDECIVSNAMTFPVDIAVLPRYEGDIEFRESAATRHCRE